MHLVDAFPRVVVHLVVVDPLAPRFLRLDDLGVQARLRQAEERVDPGEARQAEADLLVGLVERPALVERELPPAMVAATDVVVPVHLEDVAVVLVDDQAADHVFVVVLEVAQLFPVSASRHQAVQRHVERQLLDLSHGVHGERVVHVESDHADLVHLQRPVRVDLPAGRQFQALVLRAVDQALDFGVPQNVLDGIGGGFRDRHAGRSMIPPGRGRCKHFTSTGDAGGHAGAHRQAGSYLAVMWAPGGGTALAGNTMRFEPAS